MRFLLTISLNQSHTKYIKISPKIVQQLCARDLRVTQRLGRIPHYTDRCEFQKFPTSGTKQSDVPLTLKLSNSPRTSHENAHEHLEKHVNYNQRPCREHLHGFVHDSSHSRSYELSPSTHLMPTEVREKQMSKARDFYIASTYIPATVIWYHNSRIHCASGFQINYWASCLPVVDITYV